MGLTSISVVWAKAENFPFCTIEPNMGRVAVPDDRLEVLGELSGSARVVPTSFELIDVAGLIEGASKGQGLGNQFLSTIRGCHSLVQVVRCFTDVDVHHVDGDVDPIRDAEVINTELLLADLGMLERKLAGKGKGKGKPGDNAERVVLGKLEAHLGDGHWARTLELSQTEADLLREMQLALLTSKPVVYAANVSEDGLASGNHELVAKLAAYAAEKGDSVVVVSATTEVTPTFLATFLQLVDPSRLMAAHEFSCALDFHPLHTIGYRWAQC